MEFVHQPYVPGETIAAIATPPGEGGVAIIRISGTDAVNVAEKIFSGPLRKYKSHSAHFGKLHHQNGQFIDEVLILPMLAPRSYTGENTVEIHCHGGSLVTRRVLDAVLDAGARAARPGEFTFRAFMNGKLDLAQAEAVQALIGAKNEKAVDAAENQLQGRLSLAVTDIQQRLTLIAAILEAWVDFPEEGLEFASMDEICHDLDEIGTAIEKLASTFHQGKILYEGLSLCLVGPPNVGKSSLMNALLDKDRAIVSPTPGTTRDILEDQMRLNGLHLKISDTAGIRVTTEGIEQEGIRRSKKALKEADLILLVLDAGKGVSVEDIELLESVPKQKTILVWNKIDLPHHSLSTFDFPFAIQISAKEGIGLDTLHAAIDRLIWEEGPPSKEEIVITNIRHQEALVQSAAAVRLLLSGLKKGVSPEFLMIDIRQALNHLGQVIGTNISEDILSAIFSTFCIGK